MCRDGRPGLLGLRASRAGTGGAALSSPRLASQHCDSPQGHSPEMVLLILTKIFSKSAKSFQEDWNMCMKRLMNRFSILQTGQRHLKHAAASGQTPPHCGLTEPLDTPWAALGTADWPVEPDRNWHPRPMLFLLHPSERDWLPAGEKGCTSAPCMLASAQPSLVHSFTLSASVQGQGPDRPCSCSAQSPGFCSVESNPPLLSTNPGSVPGAEADTVPNAHCTR